MSTPHIAAERGEIAERVLLPGDPLRAKHIAETFLTDARCYSNIRNVLGYTGLYKGKRISVQSTGMGIPSISIYTKELITEYGAKTLIRVGNVMSNDRFYNDEIDKTKLRDYGCFSISQMGISPFSLSSPAEAKQTGQCILQRFVTSRIIQQPFLSCSSQSPQLSGQDFSLTFGFTGVSAERFSLPQER